MDKSMIKSHPPSLRNINFLSDRPQLIQHQGVLFKFQVIFQAETPSPLLLSEAVESELGQVLQNAILCILTESDPPDLIRTENLCVRPQLKFWPLAQQLSCLQTVEGVIPCDRMIELHVIECSPHMLPPLAAAGSGTQSSACGWSDPNNTGSFPAQQRKESTARVRFRCRSSSESMELEETKTRLVKRKGKKKHSLYTKHTSSVVRNSTKENPEKMNPSEKDGDDSEKEAETSPMRGMTDRFSQLTFFSPRVKQLKKRKPPKRSPTLSKSCRSPRSKIPRNATAEPLVESTSTQDRLQSTSFRKNITNVLEETEDDPGKHTTEPSLPLHKSSLKTKDKRRKVPIRKLSHVHDAAGEDSCGQKRLNLLDWLSEDFPSIPSGQNHRYQNTGIQEVPSAHGDHHSSYKRNRSTALREWLSDATDWNFQPSYSKEGILDDCVLNDSDAPDVEVCTPPFLTDGISQAESNQHLLNNGLSPGDRSYGEASVIEVCYPSHIRMYDRGPTNYSEGKGSKHAMSSPEEMPLKRLCRRNTQRQNTTQPGQAKSSRCDKDSNYLKPRIPENRKAFTSSRKLSSSESSESAATREETSISPGSSLPSGLTESEPALSSSDSGSSRNACTSPATSNTSPDSSPQEYIIRSTKSKRVTFKPEHSRKSPKIKAFEGKTKQKTVAKMNSAPFWARAIINKSRERGMEYVQTQIKHFVKKMPTEGDEQPSKRNKVQCGDVQIMPEKRTAATKTQKRRRLYSGNVLLPESSSGEETLGKTMDCCINDFQDPFSQSGFSVPCRSTESSNEMSQTSGHHNCILRRDSDSSICNGNNCSSDSQDKQWCY